MVGCLVTPRARPWALLCHMARLPLTACAGPGCLIYLLGDLQGRGMEVKLTDLLEMIKKKKSKQRTCHFHILAFPNMCQQLGLKTRAGASRGSRIVRVPLVQQTPAGIHLNTSTLSTATPKG